MNVASSSPVYLTINDYIIPGIYPRSSVSGQTINIGCFYVKKNDVIKALGASFGRGDFVIFALK